MARELSDSPPRQPSCSWATVPRSPSFFADPARRAGSWAPSRGRPNRPACSRPGGVAWPQGQVPLSTPRRETTTAVNCFARVENSPEHVREKVTEQCDWDEPCDYLEQFSRVPLGPNIAPMIPHSMLRVQVMGLPSRIRRDADERELDEMCQFVERAVRDRAPGTRTVRHIRGRGSRPESQAGTGYCRSRPLTFPTSPGRYSPRPTCRRSGSR